MKINKVLFIMVSFSILGTSQLFCWGGKLGKKQPFTTLQNEPGLKLDDDKVTKEITQEINQYLPPVLTNIVNSYRSSEDFDKYLIEGEIAPLGPDAENVANAVLNNDLNILNKLIPNMFNAAYAYALAKEYKKDDIIKIILNIYPEYERRFDINAKNIEMQQRERVYPPDRRIDIPIDIWAQRP